MRFSPKDVKMTWLGIGKTAPLEFRTEKKIFEKNIGGGLRKPPPLGQHRVNRENYNLMYVGFNMPACIEIHVRVSWFSKKNYQSLPLPVPGP